jgi:hypothetical protein
MSQYVSLLVETKESHVTLCNAFHIWKPSDPGSVPPLDLTYGGINCLLLRFPVQTYYIKILSFATYSLYYLFIIIIILSGMRLSPLDTAAIIGLLYQPQMIDGGDCGEIGGMRIGRGIRSTRRKPASAPLCPPQIPHDQTRVRTRAAAVESQRLTA